MKYTLNISNQEIYTMLPDNKEVIDSIFNFISKKKILVSITESGYLIFTLNNMIANQVIIDALKLMSSEEEIEEVLNSFSVICGSVWSQPETEEQAMERIKNIESPIEREKAAKEYSKMVGCSVSTINKLVKEEEKVNALQQAKDSMLAFFPIVKPFEGEVVASEIYNEIRLYINRYLYLTEEQEIAATLWVIYTWFIKESFYCPLAHITAAEAECGKTELMSLMSLFSKDSFLTSACSVSALMRIMEEYKPTLFIDEADVSVKGNEELRGILDAGVSRTTSKKIISTSLPNKDFAVRAFDTFGPKCLAGIGNLHPTISSRSVIFRMIRKPKNVIKEDSSLIDLEAIDIIKSKMLTLYNSNNEAFRNFNPDFHKDIYNRSKQVWTPLFKAASLAGEEWLSMAYKAANSIETENKHHKIISDKVLLIEAIHDIFVKKEVETLSSGKKEEITELSNDEIIEYLTAESDSRWNYYGKFEHKINGHDISNEIKRFQDSTVSIIRYRKGQVILRGWKKLDIEKLYSKFNSRGE